MMVVDTRCLVVVALRWMCDMWCMVVRMLCILGYCSAMRFVGCRCVISQRVVFCAVYVLLACCLLDIARRMSVVRWMVAVALVCDIGCMIFGMMCVMGLMYVVSYGIQLSIVQCVLLL